MKRKNYFIIFAALALFQLLTVPSYSCVGRVLILGVSDSPDQMVVGQLLATLINERTGTTVEITKPGNEQAVHNAMIDGKAQIYITYLNATKSHLDNVGTEENASELYAKVRQSYIDKFGFIMLKPFGYDGPEGDNSASIAFPVTTKETLKGFPVLDRVINKLGGKVDAAVIEQLREKAKTEDLKDVVKSYLKSRNMI